LPHGNGHSDCLKGHRLPATARHNNIGVTTERQETGVLAHSQMATRSSSLACISSSKFMLTAATLSCSSGSQRRIRHTLETRAKEIVMFARNFSGQWVQRTICLLAAVLIVGGSLSAGTIVAQMAQHKDYSVTITQLS
jgi:hypothetical protein